LEAFDKGSSLTYAFVSGAYVSIRNGHGDMHTFQVVSVEAAM
jgi:hypothetical protein